MPPLAAPERLELEDARLGRGTYTDDTEMTIALAEVLVEHGCCDEQALAQRFVAVCDPRRGYGGGTLSVFRLWRHGVPVEEAAARVFGGGSFGNGAAMRVAPVGIRFADDPRRLHAEAVRSARITHAHPDGVAGAVVQAAAVAAAVGGQDPLGAAMAGAGTDRMRLALEAAAHGVAEDWPPQEAAARLGNAATAPASVPAALLAACRAASFEDACSFAVGIGGDADTIAAMAGAVAGARFGAAAIPQRWLEPLEDGIRGKTHVEQLARRLARAAGAADTLP